MSHDLVSYDAIPRIRVMTEQEVLNAVILDQDWVPQKHDSLAVTIVNALPLSVGDIEIGAVNILSASDQTINPGTEETLLAILAALGGAGGGSLNLFNEANAVPAATPTKIVELTVPAGKTFKLLEVHASGTNVANFWVVVDGTIQARKRSYYTHYNVDFTFPGVGLEVSAGKKVSVHVQHTQVDVGDFDANLFGALQ